MSESPLVYIILVTWNHWSVTAVCLPLLQQLTYPRYRLLVVDNGSTDQTVAHIRAEYPTIELIENGRNLGFAAGCNVGMRHAMAQGADYVLLLNNDTQFEPDFLAQLMHAVADLPQLGMAAPALAYEGEPQKLWFTGSQRHPWTLEAVDFGHDGPRRHTQPDQQHEVDYIFGTVMLLPTAVLAQLGLFDEAYFMYYEDMDLCLRLQAAGYKLYYIPSVRIQHSISASTDTLSSKRYYYKACSSVIFFRKHGRYGRGWIIALYRTLSAIRTLLRLLWRREWPIIPAYIRGLKDGFFIKPQLAAPLRTPSQ